MWRGQKVQHAFKDLVATIMFSVQAEPLSVLTCCSVTNSGVHQLEFQSTDELRSTSKNYGY